MEKWKTDRSEILLDTEWVKVCRDSVRLPNGQEIDDFYTVTIRDAAAIVALDEAGNLILKNEYRYCYGRSLIEVPAGTFEADETDGLAVAKRELLEETGYVWQDRFSASKCALPSLLFSLIISLRDLLDKPASNPPGKAPVDVLKKQVLLLALNQNREVIARKIVVGGAGGPKIPHSIDGKCPAIRPGDGLGLHIPCGIKVGIDLDIDPFHVRR